MCAEPLFDTSFYGKEKMQLPATQSFVLPIQILPGGAASVHQSVSPSVRYLLHLWSIVKVYGIALQTQSVISHSLHTCLKFKVRI